MLAVMKVDPWGLSMVAHWESMSVGKSAVRMVWRMAATLVDPRARTMDETSAIPLAVATAPTLVDRLAAEWEWPMVAWWVDWMVLGSVGTKGWTWVGTKVASMDMRWVVP